MLFCVQIHGSAGWVSWPAGHWHDASPCQQKRKASDVDAGYGAAAAEEAILSPPTVVDLCSSDDETDPLCAISAVGQAMSAPVWEVASAPLWCSPDTCVMRVAHTRDHASIHPPAFSGVNAHLVVSAFLMCTWASEADEYTLSSSCGPTRLSASCVLISCVQMDTRHLTRATTRHSLCRVSCQRSRWIPSALSQPALSPVVGSGRVQLKVLTRLMSR